MEQENKNQEAVTYRMHSTRGLRLLALTGHIHTDVKVTKDKLYFETFPKRLNRYPEVDLKDVAIVEQGRKFAIFYLILAVISFFCVITIPYFLWLGSNTTVTVRLKNGDSIVMYSSSKKRALECYLALQEKLIDSQRNN